MTRDLILLSYFGLLIVVLGLIPMGTYSALIHVALNVVILPVAIAAIARLSP